MPDPQGLITPETALTLSEAAKLFGGKRPSRMTVWRWCRHGLRGVRLAYIRRGRAILTSRAAVLRFTRDLAEADQADDEPPPRRRPRLKAERSEAKPRATADAASSEWGW